MQPEPARESRSHTRLREKAENINVRVENLKFMEVFETETNRLQGETYPTLQYVMLAYYRLLKLCEPQDEDDLMMARLRERGRAEVSQRMLLDDYHKIATFHSGI